MVKPGAAVLDVGLTRTEEGIRGDVDPAVAEVAGYLTPMPGGTGPMTIAMLLGARSRPRATDAGSLHSPGLALAFRRFVHRRIGTVGRCCSQEDVRWQ